MKKRIFLILILFFCFSPSVFAEEESFMDFSDLERVKKEGMTIGYQPEKESSSAELPKEQPTLNGAATNVTTAPTTSDVPLTNYENGLTGGGAAITDQQFEFDDKVWEREKEISFECPPPENFSDPSIIQEYEACRQAQQSMLNPGRIDGGGEQACSDEEMLANGGQCPSSSTPEKSQPVVNEPGNTPESEVLAGEPEPEVTNDGVTETEQGPTHSQCAGTSNPQSCDAAVDYANQNCSSRTGESKRACLDNLRSTCGGDEACLDAAYESQGIDRREMLQTEQDLNQINQDMQYAEQLVEQCNSDKSEAQKCCGNPKACYTGGESLNGLLQTVAMMKGASGNSISESCGVMKDLSNAGALANTVALGICDNNRGECDGTCKDAQARLEGFRAQVQAACSRPTVSLISGASAQCRQNLARIDRNKSTATRNIAQCEALSEQQTQLGMQVGSLVVASKLADACEEATTNQQGGPDDYMGGDGYADTGVTFSGDCSNPSFSSHPTCVACNKDPSLKQCALVIGFNEEDETVTTASKAPGSSDLGESSFSSEGSGLGSDEDLEKVDPSYTPAGNSSLASNSSNGGSGGPNSSGSGLQALGRTSSGGHAGKGYNTNILRGARGGGGYVSRMGFKNSGGYSSSSSGGSHYNGVYYDKFGNKIDRGIAADKYHLNQLAAAMKDPGKMAYLKQQYNAKTYAELKRKMLAEAARNKRRMGMQGSYGNGGDFAMQPPPELSNQTFGAKLKGLAKRHRKAVFGSTSLISLLLMYFMWFRRREA